MQINKIIYEPKAYVEFTGKEIDALIAASESHYDRLCRHQAEDGGILSGLRAQGLGDPAERLLTVSEVNLLCKIAERLYLVQRAHPELCPLEEPVAIQWGLQDILNKLNSEYRRLNDGGLHEPSAPKQSA